MATPTMPTTSLNPGTTSAFNNASNNFNKASENAMPSIQSLDNAAARVRSRLAGQSRSNQMQVRDSYAGTGTSASGMQRNALARDRAATTSAYAGELTDLNIDFWDKQQQGAKILNEIGMGQTALGSNYSNSINDAQKINNSWFTDNEDLAIQNKKVDNDYEIGMDSNQIQEDWYNTQDENTDEALMYQYLSQALLGMKDAGEVKFTGGYQNNFDDLLAQLFEGGGLDDFDPRGGTAVTQPPFGGGQPAFGGGQSSI